MSPEKQLQFFLIGVFLVTFLAADFFTSLLALNSGQPSLTYSFLSFIINLTEGHYEFVLAVGTIAIAAFTATLWRSTDRLWHVTRDSVEALRREFVSTHRPKLIVREAYVPSAPINGVSTTTLVTMVNVGETAATITESTIGFDLVKAPRYVHSPRPEGRNDLDASGPIAPGESHTFTVTSIDHVWGPEIFSNSAPNPTSLGMGFFLVGHVAYEDEIGIRRQTAFWRRYNRETQRFAPVSNDENEYEYSD